MIGAGVLGRFRDSVGAWVAVTVLTCGSIFAIEVVLHTMSDRSLRQAAAFVGAIGHARNDLYLGFLHVSLADSPSSPWQRDQGRALLAQARDEFRDTIALIPTGVEGADRLTAELEEFSRISQELEANPADPKVQLRMRSALFQLDRLAARFDAEARASYARLNADLHPIFIAVESLSVLLLVMVGTGTVWAHRRQNAATISLRRSEERFRRLFEDAPTPIGLIDGGGRLSYNAAFMRTFGYDRADLPTVEAWWQRAYPDPEYRAEVRESWQSYLGQSDPHARIHGKEYRVVCKDGSERFVVISGIELPDGSILAIFSDVTERTRAEHELYENRERLRLLVEHAPVALAMFDRQMRYLVASRRWILDHRLADQDLIDRSHYDVFPEISEAWKAAYRRGMAGEVVRMEEDHLERADGTRQWLRWEVRPWYDHDGAVGGIVIFTEDITARKKAEAELRLSQEKLAHSQKLEAVGQLTGGVAHDFNNLLAVIMGNVELLKVESKDRPELLEFIDRALRATRRGAELTRRLLAYSRQQELRPELTDINGLVREMVQLFARTLGENIAVETRLAPDVDGAIIDRGQLENALLNLAVNARDAMPDGGRLVIETARAAIGEPEAKVYGIAPGAYESIVVTDTGKGMSPEVLARAFDPFFTTKEVGKGTGLGLSMVYGFARQSGGHAAIYSEPGRGTTVRLYLPRPAAAEAGAVASAAEAQQSRGRGERILLVEDSAEVRQLVTAQLNSLGYRVTAFESGSGALEHLAGAAPVDLMLTDVVLMGGIDGVVLADAARRQRPGLRVLYMSGYAEGGNARERIKATQGRLLQKPFTITQLSEAIVHCLETDEAGT